MKYLLGIDLGTSGTKTVLFDQNGKGICSATVEYPMYQPQNGWAEQDPKDWYNAAVSTIRTVLEKSGVDKKDVVSLGISGQMHGLVMLDEKDEVIRPSIIWCDQRTAKECEEITAKVGYDNLIRITANPALPGFTLSKLIWVRNHEPENYAKCKHVLLPKDYVRFMLTGDFATEVSDASGMQMLDVPNRCWSDELLQILDIDKSMLAKVYESCEVTGHISAKAAELTGLSEKTLVVGGAGDNAAAAVGTGVVEDGKAFTTIGTSGVVFAHTDKLAIDPKGRVHTFCCAVPGAWHVMGVTQAAGLSLKWFRDNFCAAEKTTAEAMGVDTYELTNQEAAQSPIGANKLIYAPYSVPDGRADPASGQRLPRYLLRTERDASAPGPAACRDGRRYLQPERLPRRAGRHGRRAGDDAGLRRRRKEPPVAADAGGRDEVPRGHHREYGRPGAGRGHPGRRRRGTVRQCAGSLPGDDPGESCPGSH